MDAYDQKAWDALERERQRQLSRSPRRLVPAPVREQARRLGRKAHDGASSVPGFEQAEQVVEEVFRAAGDVGIEVGKLAGMIVRNATWKQLDQNVITKIVRRTFELLGMRITKQKLAAALPIIGIAIGASLNARTLSKTADAADLLYRQQFLCDKYDLPFPKGETQHAAGPQDDEDIAIAEIIEEEIDGEDGEHPPALPS